VWNVKVMFAYINVVLFKERSIIKYFLFAYACKFKKSKGTSKDFMSNSIFYVFIKYRKADILNSTFKCYDAHILRNIIIGNYYFFITFIHMRSDTTVYFSI
jgi:hypothetical protein